MIYIHTTAKNEQRPIFYFIIKNHFIPKHKVPLAFLPEGVIYYLWKSSVLAFSM